MVAYPDNTKQGLGYGFQQLPGNHHHVDGLITALRLMMPAQSGSERAFARQEFKNENYLKTEEYNLCIKMHWIKLGS